MSFPILRADLNMSFSPKLKIDSLTIPNTSTFVEKRILTLSKQIAAAAIAGKKTHTVKVVVQSNLEPVLKGLKENFPDAVFTVSGESTTEGLTGRGGLGEKGTFITISWEVDEVIEAS